jgi:hypothetical protein
LVVCESFREPLDLHGRAIGVRASEVERFPDLKDSSAAADDHSMRHQLFMSGTFAGVGLLALWVHLRFPRLEPPTLRRASVHVAASIAVFHFVPVSLHELAVHLPMPLSVVVGVSVILVPTFGYVLLSWLWLLARLRDHMGSSPRGGHPVRSS